MQSLPKKTLIAYEELRILCDSLSNFNSLRTAIRTSVPPTIPYLGTITIFIYFLFSIYCIYYLFAHHLYYIILIVFIYLI
jgi:hypothetical protein